MNSNLINFLIDVLNKYNEILDKKIFEIESLCQILNWKFKKKYKANEICIYNNMLYQCINDIESSLTDPSYDITNWKMIGNGFGSSSIKFLNFTPNYSYSYGDVIRHNKILYCAKKSFISSYDFNEDDWELASGDLKSNVLDLNKDGIIDLAERALIADMAKESELLMSWKPNKKYNMNQQVLYLEKIYSVVNDHISPSVFNENDDNLKLIASGTHNNLLDIQGGKKDEYYHIKKDNYDAVSLLHTNVNGDLVYNNKIVGNMNTKKYDTNNDGIVNSAHTLDGLMAKIDELNYLIGTKGNIQKQIDNLSSIANFTRVVELYEDLNTIDNPNVKDISIVSNDQTNDHNGKTTIYIYNGTNWEYITEFDIKIRDFITDPIDINSESIGIIPDDRIADTIARKNDIVQLENSVLLSEYTQTDKDLKDAVSKKHIHANLELLNSYNQTNVDITKAIKQMHTHNNISTLNKFSEDADGNLLYAGKGIENGASGGIYDLSNFNTSDLNDSLNRRYVTDTEKENINNLSSIVIEQTKINNTLTSINESIPSDATYNNQLITDNVLKTKIEQISFKNLTDVDKTVKGNAFVVTDNEGNITYKQDLNDLVSIKKITDKNGTEFTDITSLKFDNLKGILDSVNNEVILDIDNLFTTDLKDMPDKYEDNKLLVSNLRKMKYELKDISELVSCKENYTKGVKSDEWGLNDDLNKYTKVINHDLNSKNLIVSIYNEKDIIIDYVSYQILDNNNIMLIVDNILDCRIVINCSQGTTGNGSNSNSGYTNVLSSDFIDDTRQRNDKTYSSNNIMSILQSNYLQISNAFTKNQANARFSLKENEHVHTNSKVLNKLNEDVNGDLFFNNKRILTELQAYTYQQKFINESHPISLDMILDINEIMTNNNYKAIMQCEFTIKNNISETGTDEDEKIENKLHLVVIDNTLTVLDVYISPSDTQKYILGISPNMKIMAQLPNGTFDANFYMTTY